MNEWQLESPPFQICFMLNFVQERRIIPNVFCLGPVLLFYEEPLVSFSSAKKKKQKTKEKPKLELSWFQFHT